MNPYQGLLMLHGYFATPAALTAAGLTADPAAQADAGAPTHLGKDRATPPATAIPAPARHWHGAWFAAGR